MAVLRACSSAERLTSLLTISSSMVFIILKNMSIITGPWVVKALVRPDHKFALMLEGKAHQLKETKQFREEGWPLCWVVLLEDQDQDMGKLVFDSWDHVFFHSLVANPPSCLRAYLLPHLAALQDALSSISSRFFSILPFRLGQE